MIMKVWKILPLALLVSALGAGAAFAEADIDAINLYVDYSDISAGDDFDESDVTVTVTGGDESLYSVSDTRITNQPSGGSWHEGVRPRLLIELSAHGDHTFTGHAVSHDGVNVDGDVTISSATRKDHNTMATVTVRLDEVGEGDDWDDDDDDWDWRDDEYYGPGGASGSGGYIEGQGTWMKDPATQRWWFCRLDRSFPKDSWELIGGRWYCFDGQGFMRTGWILWQNAWYYCGPNGDMYANRWTDDGYYVGVNGAWVSNAGTSGSYGNGYYGNGNYGNGSYGAGPGVMGSGAVSGSSLSGTGSSSSGSSTSSGTTTAIVGPTWQAKSTRQFDTAHGPGVK